MHHQNFRIRSESDVQVAFISIAGIILDDRLPVRLKRMKKLLTPMVLNQHDAIYSELALWMLAGIAIMERDSEYALELTFGISLIVVLLTLVFKLISILE